MLLVERGKLESLELILISSHLYNMALFIWIHPDFAVKISLHIHFLNLNLCLRVFIKLISFEQAYSVAVKAQGYNLSVTFGA